MLCSGLYLGVWDKHWQLGRSGQVHLTSHKMSMAQILNTKINFLSLLAFLDLGSTYIFCLFAGTAFLWNGYEPATAGECHVVNLKSQVFQKRPIFSNLENREKFAAREIVATKICSLWIFPYHHQTQDFPQPFNFCDCSYDPVAQRTLGLKILKILIINVVINSPHKI